MLNTGTDADTEITWWSYNKMIQNIVMLIFKMVTEMKWQNFLGIARISDIVVSFGLFGPKFHSELMESKFSF